MSGPFGYHDVFLRASIARNSLALQNGFFGNFVSVHGPGIINPQPDRVLGAFHRVADQAFRLCVLIEFGGRKKALFCQQAVHLLHKLKSRVLFVQDQSVDRRQDDRDLALVEEQLQLLPVITLFGVVLCVFITVHRDVCGKVPRENFSDQEAVVERTSNIFD